MRAINEPSVGRGGGGALTNLPLRSYTSTLNPCRAELYVSIFYSFEAGIAGGRNFQLQMTKNISICEKYASPKLQ